MRSTLVSWTEVYGDPSLGDVRTFPHGVSSHVAIELGACGVCGSVSTGCTAGLDALNWGYLQLSSGHATAMVVGGAEALLSPFAFGSVCASGYSQNATTHPRKLRDHLSCIGMAWFSAKVPAPSS